MLSLADKSKQVSNNAIPGKSKQVGSTTGVNTEAASSMIQTFWDSAMALGPTDDDEDTRSESSMKVASEGGTDAARSLSFPYSIQPNTFGFKIEDRRGRMHRFNCDIGSLTDLFASILQRVGGDIDRNNLPQILYEDDEHDKVVLSTDVDLTTAVEHARLAGLKSLRLHLDYSGTRGRRGGSAFGDMDYAGTDAWASAYSTVAAGAALVAGLGVLAYLKRAGS